jgi:hypothetical protein
VKLVEYLGLSLKDDAMIDLLECHDVDVVYHFDRIHENEPDSYSAAAHAAGFELGFGADQRMCTLWCHIQRTNDFEPVQTVQIGVPIFYTHAEVIKSAMAAGCEFSSSAEGSGPPAWVRLEYKHRWDHYQFDAGALTLVTLMLPWN